MDSQFRNFSIRFHLHCSIAVVETCPINFIIRYGVAKISPKNVMIGHADTFFGWPSAGGDEMAAPPFAAAENISLKRSVDGSTFLRPNIYSNLNQIENKQTTSQSINQYPAEFTAIVRK